MGGGPVGLTAACELRRRGVDCRIVDRLDEPPQYAKAVGIQPRTLELWEAWASSAPPLDAAAPLHGQIVYVNGERGAPDRARAARPRSPTASWRCRSTRPSGSCASTCAASATRVERGVELARLRPGRRRRDRAVLAGPDGEEHVARALPGRLRRRPQPGPPGARAGLRGRRLPEEYMLGDVELDWDLPTGYASAPPPGRGDGTDDLLVCIPLPGTRPLPHLDARPARAVHRTAPPAASSTAWRAGRRPQLRHIQAASTGSRPSPPPRPTCAGRRSSGSATGSSTATASAGSSWPATPRTSTRRPARRA